jgi:hypothetical protein
MGKRRRGKRLVFLEQLDKRNQQGGTMRSFDEKITVESIGVEVMSGEGEGEYTPPE